MEPDGAHASILIDAYVADELGEPDRRAVERHLDVCGRCRDRAAELLAAAAAAEGLDRAAPAPGLRDRVLAEIDRTPQERDTSEPG